MEGRQKTKKALPLKKRQPLRENKGCTTLFPTWFQIAGLKIGGRTVASGELKLTRATKS